MMTNKMKKTSALLFLLLLMTSFIFLRWGSYQMTVSDIILTLSGKGTHLQNTALYDIRLPRLLMGILVAAALAVSGGMMQTLTKNDLADPSLLGINAGAATMAVLFIHLKTTAYHHRLGTASIFMLPFIAILGALGAAYVLYLLAGRQILRPKRLLLMGIGVQGALNAVIMLMTFRGGVGDYNRVLIWLTGSLWGSGWSYVLALLPIVLVVSSIVMYHQRKLDIMLLSDEHIGTLGVSLIKTRQLFYVLSVILAGAATAFAGNIGFVGLICPHMARRLVGPFHRHFLIISAVLAAILVSLADAVARNVFSPVEMPVGIILSLIGVPYFMYLLIKEV